MINNLGQFCLRIKSAIKICRLSCKNWLVLSCDKIIQFYHSFVQHRTCPILIDKIDQHFGCWSTIFFMLNHGVCLQWKMNIYFVFFLVCLLLYHHQKCRKNNASIILQSNFCCYVFMKLADIVQSSRRLN